jgi:hypothetical protein
MKRRILFTLGFVSILMTTQAQKWSVQAGTAFVDYTYVYKLQDNYKLTQSSPAIHLQVNYQLKEKFSIGLSGDVSSSTATIKHARDYHPSISTTLYGVLVCGNYHYMATPKWNLWSGYAIGYGMGVNISEWKHSSPPENLRFSSSGLGWHLNVLTAAFYPVKHVGVYANVGYGYSGVAGVGITSKF